MTKTGHARSLLAAEMAEAMSREAGMAGKYDAARKIYRAKEEELLCRVARGSARGFAELDSLRKGPLYFPPTMFEGAVNYSARGKAQRHDMQPNGDFVIGPRMQGGHIHGHPATRGFVPRAYVSVDRERAAGFAGSTSARETLHSAAAKLESGSFSTRTPLVVQTLNGAQQERREFEGRKILHTSRALPKEWVKIASNTRADSRPYYANTTTKITQWSRPFDRKGMG